MTPVNFSIRFVGGGHTRNYHGRLYLHFFRYRILCLTKHLAPSPQIRLYTPLVETEIVNNLLIKDCTILLQGSTRLKNTLVFKVMLQCFYEHLQDSSLEEPIIIHYKTSALAKLCFSAVFIPIIQQPLIKKMNAKMNQTYFNLVMATTRT